MPAVARAFPSAKRSADVRMLHGCPRFDGIVPRCVRLEANRPTGRGVLFDAVFCSAERSSATPAEHSAEAEHSALDLAGQMRVRLIREVVDACGGKDSG